MKRLSRLDHLLRAMWIDHLLATGLATEAQVVRIFELPPGYVRSVRRGERVRWAAGRRRRADPVGRERRRA